MDFYCHHRYLKLNFSYVIKFQTKNKTSYDEFGPEKNIDTIFFLIKLTNFTVRPILYKN